MADFLILSFSFPRVLLETSLRKILDLFLLYLIQCLTKIYEVRLYIPLIPIRQIYWFLLDKVDLVYSKQDISY